MDPGPEVLLHEQLFYCERCNTVFLSEQDANMHEKLLDHAMFKLEES
jgi:hypothetical protein